MEATADLARGRGPISALQPQPLARIPFSFTDRAIRLRTVLREPAFCTPVLKQNWTLAGPIAALPDCASVGPLLGALLKNELLAVEVAVIFRCDFQAGHPAQNVSDLRAGHVTDLSFCAATSWRAARSSPPTGSWSYRNAIVRREGSHERMVNAA